MFLMKSDPRCVPRAISAAREKDILAHILGWGGAGCVCVKSLKFKAKTLIKEKKRFPGSNSEVKLIYLGQDHQPRL